MNPSTSPATLETKSRKPDGLDPEEGAMLCLERAARHLSDRRPELVEDELESVALVESQNPAVQRAAGNLYLKAGRLNQARAKFQLSTLLDPRCAEAQLDLGVCWILQGQLEPAGKALARAIDLDPRKPEAWKALGHLQFKRQDQEAGIESFRRALELAPNDLDCLVLIGGWLARHGEANMARTLLERAARIRPDDPGIRAELDKIRQ